MDLTVNWPAAAAAGAGMVIGFYLLIPWLIYATQRMTANPWVVDFDPHEHPPPEQTARYLDDCGEALLGLGYEPQPCVALPDPMPNVKAIVQLWIHPERRDLALVSALFGTGAGNTGMSTHYTEILSRFADAEVSSILTNNATMVSSFPDLPSELAFRFPMVKSLSQLDRLHCRLMERHGPRSRKLVSLFDEHHGDLRAYIRRVVLDNYEKQQTTGYLFFDERTRHYRPTVYGAYLMTWGQLWPMSAVIKARIRRRARQLLRELDDTEP